MNKLNQKGFAITSFLYSIFLLIIIFLVLILLLIGNSSISYFKFQKQVKEKLDEITYSTGGINNYAIITFKKDNIIIKKGESIDLLEDVKVIRYDGEEINNSIIYTSKPIFDNNKVGKYVIHYEATIDGRLIQKNRVVTVKEQTFNQEGIYITDVQIENKENSNIVYSKNILNSTIELLEQENIVTITFYNHTNKNYGLLDILKKEYSNEFIKFEVIDTGNILVSKEYTTIRLKFSYLDNTVDKTLKSILEFQFEEIPYVIASYDYTGKVEKFVVPYSGVYNLEVWGAEGGVSNATVSSEITPSGGNGGYSTGKTLLKKGDILYIGVGGSGSKNGYNGGGTGDSYYDSALMDVSASGGGATHIALNSNRGILSNYKNTPDEILIVAGGGGGAERSYGGSGGGFKGTSGIVLNESYTEVGTGGTQTSGGVGTARTDYNPTENINGSFGQGGSGAATDIGAGGGGGFYGGGATTYVGSGGGGSGFIATAKLFDKHMTCHNCEISNEYSYKTISTTNESETVIADYSKTGNGAARITLLSPIDKTVTVTINANGGKYENFETTKILVEEGSTISLQIPIKANYVFVGWNISNNTAQINQNQLTVGEEDITITANWIHKSVGSYAYTKSIQEYVVLYDGIYQLEVWGAQGGVSSGALTSSPNSFGGYGGYSTGYIQLKKGDILYIGVGGNGNLDGYNGGGTGDRYYSSTLMDTYSFGGGATHIALNTNRGTLSNYKNNTEEILIVAGGGGGAEHHAGGSGGGHKGGDGYILYDNSYQFVGTGGNQENGGTGMPSPSGAALENINGSFGQGGSGAAKDAGAGGGGGFYGGGATTVAGGAGGGSGYIGNSNLYNKHMTCFNCISNDNVDIKTITTANVSQTPNSDYAKTGDGYAKITFIECFTN